MRAKRASQPQATGELQRATVAAIRCVALRKRCPQGLCGRATGALTSTAGGEGKMKALGMIRSLAALRPAVTMMLLSGLGGAALSCKT
jgi:hypothetical protein